MQRAMAYLACASTFTASFCFYAHWKQLDDYKRMHAGVLRDIAKEEQEKILAAALPPADDVAGGDCESGVCALKKTRFKETPVGVLTDVTKEEQAKGILATALFPAAEAAGGACESGVCTLKKTRFKDSNAAEKP